MKKKGQTLGLAILSAIVVFIVGMMCINFLMPEIATARIALNCSDAASITDGTKLLCLTIDATVPYWIWGVFSIVIGAVTSRFLL